MITIENFGEDNRDRQIGHSLYRICRQQTPPYEWYIFEIWNEYPDGNGWAKATGFYTISLHKAIDVINSLTKEREVIGKNDKRINERR